MPSASQDLPSDTEQLRLAAARVGQFLCERWRLDSLLGMGGMASVYAATHRNGNRVAIKMLHPELSTDAGIRQRFIDEGYVANRVRHPGTVSVLDDGETAEGLVFLIMDLLEGQTLQERLDERATLHPHDVFAIAEGLLDVLAAAHDEGIVHRDIKPANIFITHDGTVKLLDFGIASLIEPGHPRTTQSGISMGTPVYMPPEQARGNWEHVDGRTDLWAVGATMFTALSGRTVHEGATINEELLSAMTNRAPSLADLVPRAPKRLVALIDRALAFDRAERWPDARAMLAALREARAELESQRLSTGPMTVASSEFSLVPRAMWMARTRSWRLLPKGTGSAISTLFKPASERRRRWMLALAAASTLAVVGSGSGYLPQTRTEAPASSIRIAAPSTIEPEDSAVADVNPSESDASTPSLAGSAPKEIRSAGRVNGPRTGPRNTPTTAGELPEPPRPTTTPSSQMDPLRNRY